SGIAAPGGSGRGCCPGRSSLYASSRNSGRIACAGPSGVLPGVDVCTPDDTRRTRPFRPLLTAPRLPGVLPKNAPRGFSPNSLVRMLLMDCIALASFTHTPTVLISCPPPCTSKPPSGDRVSGGPQQKGVGAAR